MSSSAGEAAAAMKRDDSFDPASGGCHFLHLRRHQQRTKAISSTPPPTAATSSSPPASAWSAGITTTTTTSMTLARAAASPNRRPRRRSAKARPAWLAAAGPPAAPRPPPDFQGPGNAPIPQPSAAQRQGEPQVPLRKARGTSPSARRKPRKASAKREDGTMKAFKALPALLGAVILAASLCAPRRSPPPRPRPGASNRSRRRPTSYRGHPARKAAPPLPDLHHQQWRQSDRPEPDHDRRHAARRAGGERRQAPPVAGEAPSTSAKRRHARPGDGGTEVSTVSCTVTDALSPKFEPTKLYPGQRAAAEYRSRCHHRPRGRSSTG